MLTTSGNKAQGKKMAGAQERLRKMQETIAPFSRPASPQVRAPKTEWVPGEYAHVRREEESDHLLVNE